MYEYKAKVSSRTGGPLISPVRQGPCGLNPAQITLDVIVHYLGHFVHIECPF